MEIGLFCREGIVARQWSYSRRKRESGLIRMRGFLSVREWQNSWSCSRICHFPRRRRSELGRSSNPPTIRDERANRVFASTRWINTLGLVGVAVRTYNLFRQLCTSVDVIEPIIFFLYNPYYFNYNLNCQEF